MKSDNSYTARRTGGDLLAALSRCQIAWQKGEFWNDFIEALATVEATAMQAGHLALHDVCIALHKRIVQLSEVQPCPDDEQCAVLATWPAFASAWAESQGEPRMGELLVEFLRHPMWPQPLDSDEAEILGVMLGVESYIRPKPMTATATATATALTAMGLLATTVSVVTQSLALPALTPARSFPMCAPE